MKSQEVLTAFKAALNGDRENLMRVLRIIHAGEERTGNRGVATKLGHLIQRHTGMVALPTTWHGLTVSRPEKSFSDLILSAEVVESLTMVKRELDHAEKLLENNLRPRNRLLFHGPPGNGKTAAAGALANLLGVPMMYVNHHDLIDSYLGGSQKNLASALDSASRQPCVLFIDELDGIGESRQSSSDAASRSSNQLVTSLLMQLDNMPQCVTFIGATNRLADLDRALVRRFDSSIEFAPPTEAQIVSYVAVLKDRHPVLASEAVCWIALAGKSFAEIETELMNRARALVLAA